MTAILAVLMLNPPVTGDAAFSYHITDVAEYRNIELDGWGSAVLDCDRIGQTAWVFVGGEWYETTVVDCVAEHHREWFTDRGRAVDLPWELWDEADLPLMPVPALVAWDAPMEGVR